LNASLLSHFTACRKVKALLEPIFLWVVSMMFIVPSLLIQFFVFVARVSYAM
jgi:hypothetical protein